MILAALVNRAVRLGSFVFSAIDFARGDVRHDQVRGKNGQRDPNERHGYTSFLAFCLAILAPLASASPPALVWGPTDHGGDISVSSATATRVAPYGSIWESARSDLSQSTGTRYVELLIVRMGAGVNVGLGNGVATPGNYMGADNNGLSYRPNGNVIKNGAWVNPSPLPPAYTTGDRIGILTDFVARTVKFNKNDGAFSGTVDITSLGPDVYVTCSLQATSDPNNTGSVQITFDSWNDYAAPTVKFIGHGDSLSNTGGVLKGFLPRLADLVNADRKGWAIWTRAGINGASWNFAWSQAGYPYTLTQDIPLRVVPALSTSIPNWVIAWAGTNGFQLAFHSVATEYANLQTDVQALIAAGVPANHIIVPTMLPRTGLSETTRSAYNAAIVDDAGHLGYVVARFDLDPTYGQAGQNTDPTKYPDGVHPVEAFHAIAAQILYALIFP